jgi:hypothetical protein
MRFGLARKPMSSRASSNASASSLIAASTARRSSMIWEALIRLVIPKSRNATRPSSISR